MNCKTCGHLKSQHIYEEGACRPGFECHCDKFWPDKQEETIESLKAQLAVAEAALVDVGRTCLCERFKTTGFDYSETHAVLGQPRMGARWLIPGELIANCLNKLQAMKNEQAPHGSN